MSNTSLDQQEKRNLNRELNNASWAKGEGQDAIQDQINKMKARIVANSIFQIDYSL
jgi:hypothetical protein